MKVYTMTKLELNILIWHGVEIRKSVNVASLNMVQSFLLKKESLTNMIATIGKNFLPKNKIK